MGKEQDLIRVIEAGKRVAERCNTGDEADEALKNAELKNVEKQQKRLDEFRAKKAKQ